MPGNASRNPKRRLLPVVTVVPFALALLLSACGGDGGSYSDENGDSGTTDTSGVTATLSSIQANVFTPSCAKSGCHSGASPAQGMSLEAGDTFANTVGVPAGQSGLDRIEPGQPDNSYLVHKIQGTHLDPPASGSGRRMPWDGPPYLDQTTIDTIRQWVTDGALDN